MASANLIGDRIIALSKGAASNVRILNVMRRRLLALVLGLIVAGAPQALEVCQFVCAGATAGAAAEGHHGHSCPHSPAPSAATTFQSVPHACGHADNLPEALGSA